MSGQKEQWGSRWGFIAASIGMAIGTGNIWRFPRVTGANGGGPFIIAWTIALFVWAIPILMGEMVMGRATGLGTIGAFRDFSGNKKFTWMGSWVAAVCLLIMFYYSVVMGWCLKYFTLAISGAFSTELTTQQTAAIWQAFTSTPLETILFHAISMFAGGYIIYKGVSGGIEKACKIMIPTLFVLLVVAMIRAITLPGAAKGLEYLFTPNIHMLAEPKIWLEAFTQAAWSTGAGWGFIITYATYTKMKEDVAGNTMILGFGDNVGALLAALTVMPAIFALSPSLEFAKEAVSQGNTGITFVYLAQLFTRMPAGTIIATIFFLAMAIAALSSLLPMIEVGVRNMMDLGVSRKKATLIVAGFGFLAGIPSAWSLNINDNQDWVWGVALLVSGLFTAIALIKFGVEEIRKKHINTPWTDFNIGKWFTYCIYAFPVMFVAIVGFWMWKATTWYENPWNPKEIFGIGTIIVQWGILLAITFLTHNYFNKKIKKGEPIYNPSLNIAEKEE